MRITWRKQAADEFREAIEYLKARNPSAAFRASQTIRQTVQRLKDQPGMGRPGRVADTRELVITGTPYIVIYTVDTTAQTVVILRVLRGARLWPEEPEEDNDQP